MTEEPGVSSLAIDLTRMHRRTVTSFYNNLVTRPTGRAVRMGVESQLAELEDARRVCLSVLDFSQVHVLDYSCADEIVAKLLLRYLGDDRPTDAFFIARGLQEHHRDAVEAVLERHDLLLVSVEESGAAQLLGPCNAVERACWSALARLGQADLAQLAGAAGLPEATVRPTVARLAAQRAVVEAGAGLYCDPSYLARER
ncbi:MAG TPA: hypothetical protein VFL93_12575 [Longimicrobiaceae bacterium]|jgi:hypothetical protein|nr:hypothetical protein [Longimicrobiaceae bacterium]